MLTQGFAANAASPLWLPHYGGSAKSLKINIPLTTPETVADYYFAMPQEPLVIEDVPGPREGQRILRLTGPLTMTTLFDFQSRVRGDNSRALLLDFSNVPYVDSAGIGALVGAYVTHQKDGHSLYLIGVNDRVHSALKITRVEQFFNFVDSVSAAEQALKA